MAEYIKIEKNTFPTFYKRNLTDYGKGWNACLKSVLQHKTADVVEVVRCKDCEHWSGIGFAENAGWCEKTGTGTLYNHFCSYGERKNGGKEE